MVGFGVGELGQDHNLDIIFQVTVNIVKLDGEIVNDRTIDT